MEPSAAAERNRASAAVLNDMCAQLDAASKGFDVMISNLDRASDLSDRWIDTWRSMQESSGGGGDAEGKQEGGRQHYPEVVEAKAGKGASKRGKAAPRSKTEAAKNGRKRTRGGKEGGTGPAGPSANTRRKR